MDASRFSIFWHLFFLLSASGIYAGFGDNNATPGHQRHQSTTYTLLNHRSFFRKVWGPACDADCDLKSQRHAMTSDRVTVWTGQVISLPPTQGASLFLDITSFHSLCSSQMAQRRKETFSLNKSFIHGSVWVTRGRKNYGRFPYPSPLLKVSLEEAMYKQKDDEDPTFQSTCHQ